MIGQRRLIYCENFLLWEAGNVLLTFLRDNRKKIDLNRRKGEILMKAKVAVLFLTAGFLLACVSLGLAETMVGGHITTDTVWDKAGSPYTLTQTITVDKGATLTIEPGVTIYATNALYSGHGFVVYGALIARGTQTEPIRITNRVEHLSEWGMMQFEDSSDDQNCILEYCELTNGSGVRIDSASPTISWCKIIGTGGGYGIEVSGSAETKPLITHTQIDNWVVGIRISKSSPLIDYCLLGMGNGVAISFHGPEGNPRVRFSDIYSIAGGEDAVLDARQNFWGTEALEQIERNEGQLGKKIVDCSDPLVTPHWDINWATGEAVWVEVESESWGEVKSKFE